MGNAVATLALVAWVPVTLALFRRFRPSTACSVAYLSAYLLLPYGYGFNVPIFPPLGRMQVVTLTALVALPALARRSLRDAQWGQPYDWVMAATLAGSVVSCWLNSDAFTVGPAFFTGMTLRDGVSQAIRDFVWLGLPFLYGRILFRRAADLYPLLVTYAVGGAAYSLLVLFEVRMSPNLHTWTYGYLAWGETSFAGNARSGGWRPVVFVGSGLALSLLIAHTVIASASLQRARLSALGLPLRIVTPYLYAVLVVCKSVGATVLGSAAYLFQFVLRPRAQIRLAAVLCLLAVSYPLMREQGLVPIAQLESFASAISEQRYVSLSFRFTEEKALLERASQRIWFGWGTYGRPLLYDPETGEGASIADGYWIIVLGSFGIVGFLGRFLLFAVPVWLCWFRFDRLGGEREQRLVMGLAWILTTQLIDNIPNAMVDSIHFFLCGALAGVVRISARARVPAPRKRLTPRAVELHATQPAGVT